jgi:serine/threonine protein kinase
MLGGDLKFHLLQEGKFSEKRGRFYAAEILLGLEHIHSCNVIYRDIKLENVLLDHNGHCRITDLGLAVVTKTKIKGYAGTPGYTAPEMIKGRLYGPCADIFSLGVLIYRMLMAEKPFPGKVDRDLDKAVRDKKPNFPPEVFSKDAKSLLEGMLTKKPEQRLGCDAKRGIQDIKDHKFFSSIDWGLLEAGYLEPPFLPDQLNVNAASLKDIGAFDRNKYRNIKLNDKFRQQCQGFEYVSKSALQAEMVEVLQKADESVNFERFAVLPESESSTSPNAGGKCCVIL